MRRSTIGAFHRVIMRWFLTHQRDLPWRRTRDPYRILVSEIMLQQTQVDRVIPKYRAFLRRFPTVRALARATPRDVLLVWAGMGYNRRALYLQRLACEVLTRFGGQVPTTVDALVTLPGVGTYTAAAVATFSTGVPHPLADTNVKRVTARVFGGREPSEVPSAHLQELIERTMPRRPVEGVEPALWGHALMDFGALVCRARPRCETCPLQRMCKAYPSFQLKAESQKRKRIRRDPSQLSPASSQLLPDRVYRGRILQGVRDADPFSVALTSFLSLSVPESRTCVRKLVRGLVRDGLLEWATPTAVRLPRGGT